MALKLSGLVAAAPELLSTPAEEAEGRLEDLVEQVWTECEALRMVRLPLLHQGFCSMPLPFPLPLCL